MNPTTLRSHVLAVFFFLLGAATLVGFNTVVQSHAAGSREAALGSNRGQWTTNNLSVSAMMPAGLTLTVDTTLDNPALLACTAAPSDCSLRGAIITANLNAGSTIILPAGTYALTLAGAGEQFAATGDLDVRASGTSIVGAGAATTIIQQTTADRLFETNPVPQAAGFVFSISGVTIKDGNTTGSGGGILGGGPASTTTISNCVFDNDRVTGTLASNGGAISFTSAGAGDLNISGSSFTNNTTATGIGGAIRFSTTGTLTVTSSSFTGNKTTTNSGGAINVTGPGAGGTYNISQSSFVNNQALGSLSRGGAILLANGNLNVSYNRLIANISGSGIGTAVSNSGVGIETVNNNWWGSNTGPAGGDVFGTTVTTWLQLRHTANPNPVCVNGTTTLTADLFGLNSGGITAASNLTGLPAFPSPPGVIFSNATLGTLSSASTQFVDGVAMVTYTAGSTTGTGTADAKADNQTVTASITIQQNTTSALTNQAQCEGGTATFATTASGPATNGFTFVWKQGSTVLNNGDLGGRVTISTSGANSSLSISGLTLADAGTYTVEATGDCSTASSSATLTVQPGTSTTAPADQTVCQGGSASFSTTASGTGPFSYAWTLDGSSFDGNNASINVPTGSLSVGNHSISVTVTGACGSDTKNATLTVQENTSTTDPPDQTVCQGAMANFSTTAGGTGPFHYAWTLDGSPFNGDNSTINVDTTALSVSNHTVAVTTTGACGTASQSATLTVQANTSTSDPSDQTVCQGAMASFSTTAGGTGPFHYAWTVDGSSFNGDSSSVNVDTTALSVGSHTVAVTTTGTCGSASQSATLTVQATTSTTDPPDQTVCQGATATFSTTAGGTGPFHYAWTLDGSPFNGDSASINIPTGSLSQGAHTVTVTTSGTCGSASQSATLTVHNDPPVILVGNSSISLWPPNHQYHTFTAADFGVTANSNCDGNITSKVVIASVTSDELDDNPGGADGNTVNDIVIAPDCKSVQLRAERDGSRNGRVYTITFRVTDSVGHTTTATARVNVPTTQNGAPAVDDGPHNVVVGTCP